MARSKWKGPFFNNNLYDKIVNFKESLGKELTTWNYQIWSRNSVIPAALLSKRVLIHTGKIFKKAFINRQKVGLKFGSLVNTRKFTFVMPKNSKLKKK
jgi:ribosomal protein S19